MSRRFALPALGAGLIVAAALGVAACGSDTPATSTTGSTEATRRAAAAPSADGTCADRSPSSTFRMRIINALPGRAELRVPIDSFDCFDWSGVSTPYTAFNRQSVGVGQTRGFTLETYDRAGSRWWTMGLRAFGSNGDVDGSTRLGVRGSGLWAESTRKVPGDGHLVCSFAPVGPAPSGWRDTPQVNLRPEDGSTYTVAVADGSVGFHFCRGVDDQPKKN